jgi:hypothetical protein
MKNILYFQMIFNSNMLISLNPRHHFLHPHYKKSIIEIGKYVVRQGLNDSFY